MNVIKIVIRLLKLIYLQSIIVKKLFLYLPFCVLFLTPEAIAKWPKECFVILTNLEYKNEYYDIAADPSYMVSLYEIRLFIDDYTGTLKYGAWKKRKYGDGVFQWQKGQVQLYEWDNGWNILQKYGIPVWGIMSPDQIIPNEVNTLPIDGCSSFPNIEKNLGNSCPF